MYKKSILIIGSLLLLTSLTGSNAKAMTGLGFGVHGGVITGYNNQTLEQSFRQSFGDLSDFRLKRDMTDFGVHIDMNTFHVIAFDVNGDYMWRNQNVSFVSG